MRTIYFILSCAFLCSSSNCTEFGYYCGKWVRVVATTAENATLKEKVEKQGKYYSMGHDGAQSRPVNLTTNDLYYYIKAKGTVKTEKSSEDNKKNVLTLINSLLNHQIVCNVEKKMKETGKGSENDKEEKINEEKIKEKTTLAVHLVNKGHYGFLPFKPLDPKNLRKEYKGKTLVDRLEVNEPRSYFSPATKVQELASEYSKIIQLRLNDLFFPGVVSATLKEDTKHADAYNAVYNEMLKEAKYLISDVRDDNYVAEEIDHDSKNQTIRIIAQPADLKGQMRDGLQPSADKTSYINVGKRICIYIQVNDGKIEIKTIFPCRNLDSLHNEVNLLLNPLEKKNERMTPKKKNETQTD